MLVSLTRSLWQTRISSFSHNPRFPAETMSTGGSPAPPWSALGGMGEPGATGCSGVVGEGSLGLIVLHTPAWPLPGKLSAGPESWRCGGCRTQESLDPGQEELANGEHGARQPRTSDTWL